MKSSIAYLHGAKEINDGCLIGLVSDELYFGELYACILEDVEGAAFNHGEVVLDS